MRIIMAAAIYSALLIVAAAGSITIDPSGPEAGHKIVATVSADIPPGATMKSGGWSVDGAEIGKLQEPNALGIWTPKAGNYLVTYRGHWVLLGPPITVKDINGVDQTFTPYIDSGMIDEAVKMEVVGPPKPEPGPDPTPSPAPIPVAGLHVLIVAESSQSLPKEQQAILTGTVWQEYVGQGKWRVLDPDSKFLKPSIWKDAMEATAGAGLPRAIVSNHPYGGYVGAVPANNTAMLDLVKKWDRSGDGGGADE